MQQDLNKILFDSKKIICELQQKIDEQKSEIE
jgi:hypothetical protein